MDKQFESKHQPILSHHSPSQRTRTVTIDRVMWIGINMTHAIKWEKSNQGQSETTCFFLLRSTMTVVTEQRGKNIRKLLLIVSRGLYFQQEQKNDAKLKIPPVVGNDVAAYCCASRVSCAVCSSTVACISDREFSVGTLLLSFRDRSNRERDTCFSVCWPIPRIDRCFDWLNIVGSIARVCDDRLSFLMARLIRSQWCRERSRRFPRRDSSRPCRDASIWTRRIRIHSNSC